MTQKRILQFAYNEALRIWAYEDEMEKKLPENQFAKARAEKAWNELEEIRQLLFKEEQKTA